MGELNLGNGWIFVIVGTAIAVGWLGYLFIERLKQEKKSRDVPTYNPMNEDDQEE